MFCGIGIDQLAAASSLLAPQRPALPPPPPIEPPSSPPTKSAPLELFAECFDWCKKRGAWVGLEEDLDDIRVQLISNGYDLNGLHEISPEEWKGYGLKGGQRTKMLKYVQKFKVQRKQVML